jgi:hypothetical protein
LVELEPRVWSFVLIGKDMILGLGNTSFLSQELLFSLKQKNITFLYQARGIIRPGTISSQWKDSDELGLTGDLAKEWDLYCRALIGSGVQLQDRSDELKWIGGDKSGILSVKNVYCALASKIWQQPIVGWRRKCWNWDLALKIKLFIWLSVENKILTWDNLQCKGWEGPSICHLCSKEPETVKHLLVNCYLLNKYGT